MAMDLMKLRAEERIKEENRAINLSKREHYASMAMQGIASGYVHTHINSDIAESIAMESVKLADALIKELNKEE